MGINVACCADIAVPQPLLNLLQAHAIGVKQACAAVAQVVETDTLHLVCYQKIREMLAQKVGADAPAHRVDVDIVEIIGAVILAADLPVQRLLFLHASRQTLTCSIEANQVCFHIGIRVRNGIPNTCLRTEVYHDFRLILLKDSFNHRLVC